MYPQYHGINSEIIALFIGWTNGRIEVAIRRDGNTFVRWYRLLSSASTVTPVWHTSQWTILGWTDPMQARVDTFAYGLMSLRRVPIGNIVHDLKIPRKI